MPSYQEMRQLALDRAVRAGFHVGTEILFRKRSGVVADVNPFFFDMEPFSLYVDLDATEKLIARRRELVAVSELVPITQGTPDESV